MLNRNESLLCIIDLQGSLFRVMAEKEELLENAQKLVAGARILGIPLLLTEQVNLGNTIGEIKKATGDIPAIVKASFSCWQDEVFRERLIGLNRRQVILIGIEAHICVYQTARDLIKHGYDVHVAADGISSRRPLNREIALRRMEREGVYLTSTEMILFELLGTALDPKAREIFRIVK